MRLFFPNPRSVSPSSSSCLTSSPALFSLIKLFERYRLALLGNGVTVQRFGVPDGDTVFSQRFSIFGPLPVLSIGTRLFIFSQHGSLSLRQV